jgi:hypothetical protein
MKYAKWISALMLLFIPALAAAQLQDSDRIVTQVPFGFVVANTVIPAGECSIQRSDPTGSVLIISNRDAKVNIFAKAAPQDSKKAAGAYTMVFHKYGDRYFLAALKMGNSRAVYALDQSKLEAEMRAQNVPATEILFASTK